MSTSNSPQEFNLKYDLPPKKPSSWEEYTHACQGVYARASQKIELSAKEKENLDFLQRNLFVEMPNSQNNEIEEEHLFPIFSQIEAENLSPTPLEIKNLVENTSGGAGLVLKSLLYVSHLSDESLDGIKNFLIESGIKDILEHYFKSYIGVVNVRAYRYSSDSYAHYKKDQVDHLYASINKHTDGLPQGTIKIMIYKSVHSENTIVSLKHGITEIKVGEEWRHVANKIYPILMFRPNLVPHRAHRPHAGYDRDCMEITILPRIQNDFLVLQAGNFAGAPINPFNNWDE